MLTDQAIKTMQPPRKGYRIIWDGKLKGFGCRISQAGTRAFVVLIESGRPKTIGRYGDLTLAQARAQARTLLAEKTLGKRHPKRVTFDAARADFLEDCKRRIKPRTLHDYTRILGRFEFPALADITPRTVLKALDPLPPAERHHCFTVLKCFFTWCTKQDVLDLNPMQKLPVPKKPRARERVLSDAELACLLKATECPRTAFHAIVRLLILTGQRRGEIACLEWSWIDEQNRTITFPSVVTKNGRVHSIPYGDLVEVHLQGVLQMEGCPYVFPASRQRSDKTTVFNSWSKEKSKLDCETGVTGWTIHDLRRTVATGLQRLGVRLEVTERILNHVSGTQSGIVAVYQRYGYLEEMRNAMLQWEQHLATLTAPRA